MPNYTVNGGHRAVIGGKLVNEGDKITLDAELGDPLVASGVLTAVRRGRPPGKRSAWTPSDDSSDDGDDGEEG